MSKLHDCPGVGLCTDQGCPAHYASEPMSVEEWHNKQLAVYAEVDHYASELNKLKLQGVYGGAGRFDGCFDPLALSGKWEQLCSAQQSVAGLLPFEQWEHENRYNGKGYTRPRGKKFKRAAFKYTMNELDYFPPIPGEGEPISLGQSRGIVDFTYSGS